MREVSKSATEVVNGLGIFENSRCKDLSQDAVQSLKRFILSEDHLVENIDYDFKSIASRLVRQNKYTHTIPVKIYVRTKNLWEPAARYLDKCIVKDR